MNRRSILTKTGKGLMEATGKTSNLSRDHRNILKEIDGKVSVSELIQKFAKMTEPELLEALKSMEREGYLREFVGKQDEAPRPSTGRTPTSASSPADGGEDLDFTAFTPAKPSAKTSEDTRFQAQALEIARQAQATRAREEAVARARAEVAARARAEAEHKARLSTPPNPKAAVQARAQTEALDQARREAEERQRREAENARLEAEARARFDSEQGAKREAEERARREIEERIRRENEERARGEVEARARREAEERVRRDAEERVRRDVEGRARKEVEERMRREEVERRMREEREQAERGTQIEAEARAIVEAEMRAGRESEERARREEEERPRREEELRRRTEEEARKRREAEEGEALERSLREQEENARREAEYREREDAQRREEEERVRRESEEEAQRAEEEEKRAEEEKHAKDEEKRAREEKKAQAKAAKKARKTVRAKEKAGEEEARDPNEASLSAREIWAKRKSGNLAKQFAAMLLLTLIVAVAALPFVPLESGPYEKAAQAWLGEPVKIGTVNLTLLPIPQLKFEKVVIGKEHPMRAAVIKATPVITSLLERPISTTSFELENTTFPRGFLPALLQNKGRRGSLGVQRIVARGLKVDIPELNLPTLEVDASLSPDGALRSVALSNAERKLSVKLLPQGEKAAIEISADTFPLPIGVDLGLSEFLAKGTVTKDELALSAAEARAFGGRLLGTVRLRWSSGWSMEGEFAVRQMETGKIAAPLLAGGTLQGKGAYSMKGLLPERLIQNAQLEGNFTIQKGSITNVDMTRLLQGSGSGGGTTFFSEMSGGVSADANRLLVRQIRLAAGLLNGTGQVEMDPQKNLSGRMQIELRALSVQARATLTLAGTLQNPQFRRSD